MKKKILSLLLCVMLCLSLAPTMAFAADASGESFTMEHIPGKTQKDVLVNGVHRVIYCMQYDYLWPVTGEGYANPPTHYTEAASIDLLTAEQQAIIQRVLFAGYPYDAVGALAPLYESYDAASASEMASNLTQGLIWTLMTTWNVPGNTHFTPIMESSGSDIPGWDDAYNALIDYALHGDPLPQLPDSFTPDVIGSTTFAKHGEYWKTDALSITNPDGFRIMYNVTVPDGVVILDKDGFEISPNWDFIDGEFVILGYTVYGGETFYLQTEHGPSAEGQSISITGSAKVPTNITQYVTNEKGIGDKGDGQGYVLHPFQTMLSVGITTADFTGGATLHAADETITISGYKTWIHGDNPENQRPTSITVHLHANGEIKQTLTVQPDPAGNWAYSFPNMPKFDPDGTEIIYTVDEGYVPDYSASYQGYNITNTYTPGITSINVEKTWNDSANHDGLRPSSVTVKLFADGIDTEKAITLTENNNWSGEFEDLVEKKDGKQIIYTVEEVPVDGYTSDCEPQVDDAGKTVGFIITNTHEVQHISVSGEKTWNHGDNLEEDRPTSITVFLHADGVVKETKTVTEADGWKWTFTDLDKYDHGTEIVYSISEVNVPNYTPSYNQSNYSITNTYTPEQTSISVNKIWHDEQDRDGIRPESVTVNLLADLKPTGKTLVLNEDNHWEDVFTDLNVFDPDGNKIFYSVTENTVDGYHTIISGSEASGYTINNTHTPVARGALVVSKTVDGNDCDKDMEFNFTVTLDDTSIDGTYGDMAFVNGVAAFPLKDGESKTATWLPEGTAYIVSESDYTREGYVSTKTGEEGTIVGDDTMTAAFTNTRNTYGDLTVSKTVEGNSASKTKEFNFTVTLDDTSINGTYGDMTFENGVATFTLKDGESKTATELPNGTAYTVSEKDYTADGYVTTKTGEEGTIVGDDTMTATFINTRNVTPTPDDPDYPKTGDSNNLTLWFALLCISGAALIGSLIYFRKRKN
ncbi:MAG: Cna B-type domain-containing protein [Lachnospiraceae bacterium]|nr:Cna B-type domain-containing protein [Lachnospiraceae bacterium]